MGDHARLPHTSTPGGMAMASVVLGFIGFVLGIWVFWGLYSDSAIFGGALLFGTAGVVFGLILRLFQRHSEMELEILRLRSQVQALAAAPAAARAMAEAAPAAPDAEPAAPVIREPLPLPAPPLEPTEPAMPEAIAAAEAAEPAATVPEPALMQPSAPLPPVKEALPPRLPHPPRVPREPDFLEKQVTAAKVWLFGGNTVARVGVLLLFLGLAFLLRYASERVTIPIELRYAAVGLVGIVLQIIGWRLRERRRNYGLLLQGVAVAILYLTIFAAMRLHALIPPQAGFVMLVAVVVFSTILAVTQDALGLAAAAAMGGFAAPILASTGGEHHVALFTYLLLLDAGILLVAWFKAWRPLNLIGFMGTLGIGGSWGLEDYQPEMLASTEPFLIAFFLMFVAIAFLFARRVLRDAKGEPPADDRTAVVMWAARQSNYLDGILLFGAPLAGFGMQFGLVEPFRYGSAFSALGLGLFYIAFAAILLRRAQRRYLALVEVFIALGVVFGTLAVPLGLDARWTSAAWAIEGAGIYWIAVKQDRRLGRAFATLVQLGAVLAYLDTLDKGDAYRLLSGSRLGAAMLAGALLSSFWQLNRAALERRRPEDAPLLAVFTYAGLFFLALIAPLSLRADGTAIAWAVLGLAALAAALRLGLRSWLIAALMIQGAGGYIFLVHLQRASGAGQAVLASGLDGLFVATLIGVAAMACAVLLARDIRAKTDPVALRSLSLLLLFGLGFLNLAVLFMLPWGLASGVWAASGVLILVVSLRLQQWIGFGFGLVLQLIGGGAFLLGAYPALRALPAEELTPLAHSGFWTPAAIALAAYIGAWRLFRSSRDGARSLVAGLDFALLSNFLLGWATLWWSFAWLGEIVRFLSEESRPHALLMAAAGTALVWLFAARRWQWRSLALLSTLLLPIAILSLFSAYGSEYHPAAHLGFLAWPAVLAVHLALLCWISDLLPQRWPGALHILGCWLGLAVLALEVRYGFILLSDRINAWRWLGWASVPAFYLLAAAQKRFPAIWPVTAFEREYRAIAALPVGLILLAWFWLGALFSDGNAEPLPYLPLVNPLELGQLLALFALLSWFRERFRLLPWAGRVPSSIGYWVLGPSALLLLTGTVLRTAHHWVGIPFTIDGLLGSMLVQASLSMLWASAALGLMIFGHARAMRLVWLTGAALVAIVVAKLFLVELTNTGGLPRIISFIGVGVLLLITGYFAPLPPKRPAPASEETPS